MVMLVLLKWRMVVLDNDNYDNDDDDSVGVTMTSSL